VAHQRRHRGRVIDEAIEPALFRLPSRSAAADEFGTRRQSSSRDSLFRRKALIRVKTEDCRRHYANTLPPVVGRAVLTAVDHIRKVNLMGEALMIQGDLGVGASYVRKARAFNDAIGWLGPQTFEKLCETAFFAT
jgi:hypothetical protein